MRSCSILTSWPQVILLHLLTLSFSCLCHSQPIKPVSGNQSGIWSRDTIYILNGSVTVAVGKTLVIEPGTEVRFPPCANNLNIYGTLKAEGTVTDSIRFIGELRPGFNCGSGGTVYFYAGSDTSSLRYLHVQNLGDTWINGDDGQFNIVSPARPAITNSFFANTESSSDISTWLGGAEHTGNIKGIIGLRAGAVSLNAVLPKQPLGIYYKILGTITVSAGTTLAMHPGVELRFFSCTDNLSVYGTLKAEGTITDSIRFIGVLRQGFNCGSGGTVYFRDGSSNSSLSYVHVESLGDTWSNGDDGQFNIISPAKPTINNCYFTGTESSSDISTWLGGMENTSGITGVIGLRGEATSLNGIIPKQFAESYYKMLGTATINTGATIVIKPGVEIRFYPCADNLKVYGTLKAEGTITDSIRFVGEFRSGFNCGSGGTVYFYLGSNGSSLSYLHVQNLGDTWSNGDDGQFNIVSPAKPTINNSYFTSTESSSDISTWLGGAEHTGNIKGIIGIRGGAVNISSNLPKTTENFPYRLLGDITVDSGATLTVFPGAVIDFYNAANDLVVNGTLKASGMPLERIVFSKFNGSNAYGGSVIIGTKSSTSVLNYVTVSKLGGSLSTSRALDVQTSNVTITNVNVTACRNYGLVVSGSSSPTITFSNLYNNPIGVYVMAGNPVFRNCNIFSNTSFGINNVSSVITDTVDARFCWWGASSGPRHSTNPGGTGDIVSSRVKFNNFKSDSVFLRNQSITFPPVNGKVFGNAPFRLLASASSGLPVSFTVISGVGLLRNDTLVIMGAGNIIIEANQSGDSAYNAAIPLRQTFTIGKSEQEIVFNAVLDTTQINTRYYLTGISSAALPIQFAIVSGNGTITNDSLSFTGVGTVIVKASQSGNQNYLPASIQKTFCVRGGNPGPISGLANVCRTIQKYKVSVAKGTVLRWNISGGGSLSNTTGDSVNVTWINAGSHILTVTSYSDCDTTNTQSRTLSITVLDSLPLTPPTNLFPANNSTLSNFPHNFSWRPVPHATSYELFIWVEGTNQPSVPTVGNINGISYSVRTAILSGFAEGKRYNWLVKAKNGCTSSASQIKQFIIDNLPDLIVRTITIADSVFSGTTIDIIVEIKNIGLAPTIPSLNWIDKFYLSADSVLDPFVRGGLPVDIELGGVRNISALNPQESYTTTLRARLPRNAVGEYYIFVLVNSNQYGESNLQNNLVYKKFYIKLTEPPDLRVDSVFARQDIFSGTSTDIRFKIINPGKNATDNTQWIDNIYISPSAIFNIQEAIKLSSVIRQGLLMPDSSYFVTANVLIPRRIFGTYYFHVYTDAGDKIYEYLYENNNTKASVPVNIILTATPDFVVSQLAAPTKAVSGETIALAYTVTNEGANAPGIMEAVWKDIVSVSRDSVFNRNSLTTVGISSIANEQANLVYGATYNRVLNVTIPAFPSGKSYLYVNSDDGNDVFEYLKENNNYRRLAIQINNPDLTVSNPQVVSSLSSGEGADIRWAITNAGQGKVLPIERTDVVWLSASPVFNSSTSIQVGQITYGSGLDTASSISQQLSIRIPDSVSGLRYLFIQTDYSNRVTEENENNNISQAIAVSIALSPSPDLVVDTVQISSDTLIAEKIYAVSYLVSNPGIADITGKSWRDRIFISSSAQFNASASEIATINQNRTLLQNQSFTQTDSFSIPLSYFNSQDTVRRYVYVQADIDDAIYEQKNGNNIFRSKELIIVHEPFPDLKVTTATGSDSFKAGATAYVQGTIINQGGKAGLNSYWYDAVLFSRDTIPDTGDKVAATKVALAPVNASVAYSTRISFTVPNGISGPYYMILVSDYTNLNRDKNRSNNYKVVKTRVGADSISVDIVLPPSSDLTVTNFVTPSIVYAGQAVHVIAKVINLGPATTNKSSWKDKVYLSTDDQVDNSDIVLQTAVRTFALKKDSTYTDSLLIFLPAGIEGNYLLLFKADADNLVYEHNAEDNNVFSSAIFVMAQDSADLIVTDVSMPAQATIGDSIIISYRLSNQSTNVAIGYIRQGIYSRPSDSLSANNDMLLASQMVQINLPSFADTLIQIKVKLLSETPNQNRIIVRADLYNNLAENDETNNTTSSLSFINMQVPVLPVNQLTPALLKNDQGLYYKIDIPDSLENGTLLICLKGDSVLAKNELYVRFGKIPSRAAFDFAYENSSGAEKIIIIPELKKGTYYLMGYGISSRVNQQNVTLLATPINFIVREVNASQGGNSGQVTVKVSGAKFTEGMTALLRSSSFGTITATTIQYVNSLTAFVTFSLKGKQIGLYDFELVKPNNATASLSNVFRIVPGDTMLVSGGNQVNGFYCYLKTDESDSLNVFVDYDGGVRIHVPFTMEVVYGNSGNIDIPIPQLLLKALNGAPVGTSFGEVAFSAFASFLFELVMNLIEENGPQGILRPGARGSKRVFSMLPGAQQYHYRLIQK